MFVTATLYALTLCAAPQSGDTAAARVLRSIPLNAITGRARAPRPPLVGSLAPTKTDPDDRLVAPDADEGARFLSVDLVTELCRLHIGERADEVGFSMNVDGSTMILIGEEATVSAGEAFVRYMEATVARPIEVSASLYRVPATEQVSGTVSTRELAARGWTRLWQASARTRSGNLVGLGKERFRRFVRDVSVEVAQDSDIGDPTVRPWFEGVRVVVEPHALVGTDHKVVLCQLAIGELRDYAVLSTGVNDHPSLEVPTLASHSGCMSGRIGDDQALVFLVTGDRAAGGQYALAVTARYEGAAPQDLGPVRFYPVSGLVTRSLATRVSANVPGKTDRPLTGDAIFPLRLEDEARRAFGQLTSDGLISVVYDALGERAERPGFSIQRAAQHLAVSGDAETHRIVNATLTSSQNRWIRTARVVASSQSTPLTGDGLFGSVASGDDTETVHTVAFPALLGRSHFAVRGIETTTIADFDVEIAQESAASDPQVVSLFDGVFISLTPYATFGGVAVDVDCTLSAAQAPLRRVAETKSGGDLYLPELTRAGMGFDGQIESGRPRELGDGPSYRRDGALRGTRQLLTVELLR